MNKFTEDEIAAYHLGLELFRANRAKADELKNLSRGEFATKVVQGEEFTCCVRFGEQGPKVLF